MALVPVQGVFAGAVHGPLWLSVVFRLACDESFFGWRLLLELRWFVSSWNYASARAQLNLNYGQSIVMLASSL